ncbi:hypothetical protein BJX70DRAFT_398337 [Aspergillus crustosus]
MASNKWMVLFIARSSSNKTTTKKQRAFLMESSNNLRGLYEREYGRLSDDNEVRIIPFTQHSNDPLPKTGDFVRSVENVLELAKAANLPVMLVILGWDGFSTNDTALYDLFKPHIVEVQIHMRVFAGKPQRFYENSVKDVLRVIKGHYDDDENLDDAKLFVKKIRDIGVYKNFLGSDFDELRELT